MNLTVHHNVNVNTGRSIPAKRRVHNARLDDTLMILADDVLLPALALLLPLALGLGALLLLLLEVLVATVICPEISENKNRERVYGEPISMTVPRLRLPG